MTTPAKKEGKVTDKERLDWLIEWLGVNDDVQTMPVRDWNDNKDARAAIDAAIRQERKGKL